MKFWVDVILLKSGNFQLALILKNIIFILGEVINFIRTEVFIMKLYLAKCMNRLGTENAFIVLVG